MTARRQARACFAVATIALLLVAADPARAYLKFGFDFNGQSVALKWTRMPVRYSVAVGGVPGVTTTDLEVAISRAFATWEAVPSATIDFQFDGLTSALPGTDDGQTTLGFMPRPDLDRVLASTSYLVDGLTGDLIESDIFFNSAFPWSVASGGQPGFYDVETIALHEIGHLSGLGHSLLGETELTSGGGRRLVAAASVMFPIAFLPGSIVSRVLQADDVAGVSDIYPNDQFHDDTGSVSGRITLGAQGIFGAHVVAFHLATGVLVGNFSLSETGQFSIAGLAPGPHVIRVEPLDDADVEAFFDADTVDLDFRATYLQRLLVVPAGGDSGTVIIEVDPK